MTWSKSKFFIVPIIIVAVILVLVVYSLNKKQALTVDNKKVVPTVTLSPSSSFNSPLDTTTPFPLQEFTGAESTQELPIQIKSVGEQKTALRRLTPLSLGFAVIEFDYEDDMFLVQLTEPKEESKTQFNSWRNLTYPALGDDKFIFN